MGPLGASCFNTLTDDTRELTESEWDAERFGWLCTSSRGFAEIKAAIEKLCHASRRCTYEDLEMIRSFFGKVHNFDQTIKGAIVP